MICCYEGDIGESNRYIWADPDHNALKGESRALSSRTLTDVPMIGIALSI